MNRIFTVLVLTTLSIHQAIGQDYISNLQVEQVGNKIYVRYDLEDIGSDQYYQVYMRLKSMITGRELDAYAVTGDIGRVRSGGDKTIVWEVLDDVSRLRGDVKIDVQADLYGVEEEASNSSDISTTNTVVQEETTGDYFTDPRDGEVYKTITIGNQVWMAENLRYNAEGSYLNPDNPSKEYGRLYDWATVMDIDEKYNEERWGISDEAHQGICPRGWHIPTDDEWKELDIYLGLSPSDADKISWRGYLKSAGGWKDDEGESDNGTNSSGFNAVPAGARTYKEARYYFLGNAAFFSSSTEWSNESSAVFSIGDIPYNLRVGKIYKKEASSCRCLQD